MARIAASVILASKWQRFSNRDRQKNAISASHKYFGVKNPMSDTTHVTRRTATKLPGVWPSRPGFFQGLTLVTAKAL